jgi:hypothetical protein
MTLEQLRGTEAPAPPAAGTQGALLESEGLGSIIDLDEPDEPGFLVDLARGIQECSVEPLPPADVLGLLMEIDELDQPGYLVDLARGYPWG